MTASSHDARRQPRAVLEAAARAALRAPSVFNTQPWRWHIAGDTMELRADPDRRLQATDPQGRLLLLSCGGALHHARVALAAEGWDVTVDRFPDADRPELLARLHLGAAVPPDPEARILAGAISRRRTDRRAFGDQPVSDETLAALRRAVEAQGAYLHVVPHDQVPMLGISSEQAADIESADPGYRSELTHWTNRPAWTGDGVPPATAVEPAVRRVPVRNFAPHGADVLPVGPDQDKGAAYVILFGLNDQPLDLLRGGEALSALLLTATAEGLSTAPLTETVEVAWPRYLVRELLSDVGEPYVVVRAGYAGSGETLPATPRRTATDTITFDDQ
jgi:nitroreductase